MRMRSPRACSATSPPTKKSAIGKTTAWTAFSGLLDDAQIKGADWVRKEKQMSASSEAVYNTDQFNTFTASGTMNSPA